MNKLSSEVQDVDRCEEFVGHQQWCQRCGQSGSVHKRFARVHQPPEQNSEDKNSGSPKPRALSHSSVVVSGDSSESADLWQPIETAPKNRKVIVAYLNPLNKWRRVMATYYAEGTLECDTNDLGYAPEGWYEECETQEILWPVDGEPLYWTYLPPLPITQAGASASALSTTAPDHSPASPTESETLRMLALRKELDPDAPDAIVFPESESTLVTVDEAPDNLYDAAILLLRSWASCFEIRPPGWESIARNITADTRALLKDEEARQESAFSVHQPDVQAADDLISREAVATYIHDTMNELIAEYRANGVTDTKTEAVIRDGLIKGIRALAASPVQPEGSKEQQK